jgi:hypothetical protein
MLSFGDRVVDYGSYTRQQHSSSTSSSSMSRQSRDEQNKERFQRQEELMQNLMQSQHYIISMIQIAIFKYANLFNFQTILLNCVTNNFL